MTDQRELDRMLVAFFAEGTNELADRVIDAALDQIANTRQRHPLRVPRRFPAMTTPIRLAAAAVIGVIAVGGALYLLQPGKPAIGGTGPTPGPTASPSQAVSTPSPTPIETPAPTSDIPALTGPMGVGRQIHTATALADGRVLVVGGFGSKDDELASATLYDPAHDAFSPTGSLVAARGYHTATLLADGRVLVTGGGPASWVDSRPYLASAELYDPKTGTFSPAGSMTMSRTVHTATRLVDGRVLIVGGNRVGDQTTAGAELFDPKTGTFSPTGSLTTARSFHTATLLADGRVLIAGGDPDPWTFVRATLTSAEIYDPTSGTFSPTGSMASARAAHTATLLPDGRVLITGGFDAATGPSIGFATAEVYDPKTGTFSTTRSMTDARVYHTASMLADGRVLVLGGGGNYTDRTFLASAEVYDPKTGSFAAIASMTSARTNHAATRLADGHILVTGGYGALAPLASAEIFDPGAGAFRLVP